MDGAQKREMGIRSEQSVEIVLEVGQKKSNKACGVKQSHVSGLPAGKIDMRIERDARASQHLIHLRSPDFALEAAAERRGGGEGLRKIAPKFEIVALGNGFQQRDPLPVVH